jgi:hypothetical protein
MLSPLTFIYAVRAGVIILSVLLLALALGWTESYFELRKWVMLLFVVNAIFFVYLKNWRIALGFLLGAALFNPYFSISLSRDIWILVDVVAIVAIGYAAYWATNSYKKGTRFENYVASLFPDPDFVIQDRARDTGKKLKRVVESDRHPDFVFRSQKTGKVFAVECKWRGRWAWQPNGGQGIWWNLHQWDRYMEYQKQSGIPVYVAFGIGGTPNKPAEVYFLELDRLRFPFLFQSLIKSGKIPLTFVAEFS